MFTTLGLYVSLQIAMHRTTSDPPLLVRVRILLAYTHPHVPLFTKRAFASLEKFSPTGESAPV